MSFQTPSPKIVVHAVGLGVLPLIERLHQAQAIVGVVLGSNESRSWMLQQALEGAPMIRFIPEKEDEMAEVLHTWGAEAGLIFGFPHILPESYLRFFPRGVYNFHASPLPAYGGAQPLFWQIVRGETQSAMTLHRATEEVDCGHIIASQPFPILPDDTYGSLSTVTAHLAAQMACDLADTLKETDTFLEGIPQSSGESISEITAPGVTEEDLRIDWQSMGVAEIAALTRAANPRWNGAWTLFGDAPIRILQASPSTQSIHGVPPGTIVYAGESRGLIVAAQDGALSMDVIGVPDGIFGGVQFARRFGLDSGMCLGTSRNASSLNL